MSGKFSIHDKTHELKRIKEIGVKLLMFAAPQSGVRGPFFRTVCIKQVLEA